MNDVRRGARFALIAVTGLAALFVIAQVAQVVEVAALIHPALGWLAAIALVSGIAWLVAVPLTAYMRLTPALVPPPDDDAEARSVFVETYLKECRRNPALKGFSLENEEDLAEALEKLSKDSEAIAQRHASQIFIGTAVSQWGAFDSLVVLTIQLRMVWRIAHVFQRRPSMRQMAYLYANVVGTAFLASRLDDVDLSEFLRPVLASAFGQSIASVPGVTAVSAQVSNALFEGSVNAFLTLRVAMVAIGYSAALHQPNRRTLFRSAIARAGHLVFRTATTGAAKVVAAFGVAAAKSVGSAAVGAGTAAAGGAQAVGRNVTRAGRTAGRTISLSASKAHASTVAATSAARDRVTKFGKSTSEGSEKAFQGVRDRVSQAGERLRWRRGSDSGDAGPDDDDAAIEPEDE